MTDATSLDSYRQWASEPLSTAPRFSIVVPAYNESERVLPTIGAIATFMCSLGEPWELLVADDGSTDNTVELLEELNLVNMHVLVAEENGGKGSAVRRGVLRSSGEVILFADADQSTPIEQFPTLLAELEAGADVVIGSRSAGGASVANKSMARKVFSRGLNILARVGLGVPFADTQCGFKMFTRNAGHRLFQHQVIDEFSFDLEILFLAGRQNLIVSEVPVEWIDAPGSTVDAARVAVEFLRDMSVLRWNDVRGRYRQPNHELPDPAAPPIGSTPPPSETTAGSDPVMELTRR